MYVAGRVRRRPARRVAGRDGQRPARRVVIRPCWPDVRSPDSRLFPAYWPGPPVGGPGYFVPARAAPRRMYVLPYPGAVMEKGSVMGSLAPGVRFVRLRRLALRLAAVLLLGLFVSRPRGKALTGSLCGQHCPILQAQLWGYGSYGGYERTGVTGLRVPFNGHWRRLFPWKSEKL